MYPNVFWMLLEWVRNVLFNFSHELLLYPYMALIFALCAIPIASLILPRDRGVKELRGKKSVLGDATEANSEVRAHRIIEKAVRNAEVERIVVPATAAQNASNSGIRAFRIPLR